MRSDKKPADIFEMSRTARDKEILSLKKTIDEANAALAHPDNYFVYRDDDILRISSNMDISKHLQKLDGSLSEIVGRLERLTHDASKPSVKPQIEVVDTMKQRLSNFIELRDGMRYLNVDYSKLATSYRHHAEKLIKLRNVNEDALRDDDYDAEMPEPAILQNYSAEIQLEIERFVRFLHALFDSFTYVSVDNDASQTLLVINADDPELITDFCNALHLLDAFDSKFQALIRVLWTDFCETIMSASDPQSLVTIMCRASKTTQFTATTQFTPSDKQNPGKLLQSLEAFFTALKNSLDEIHVNEKPICDLIGSSLGNRLVEKFVMRLCAAAATAKVFDDEKNKKLQKLVEDFDAFMKKQGFFVNSPFSAREVFSRSSRLIVNQRCRVFLSSARAQVFKPPSLELVRVKGLDFDWMRGDTEIDRQLAELSIDRDELVNGDDREKFFAFRECSISASTHKIVSIFGELLKLSHESTNELEALNYFQAALVVIDTFIVSVPRLHQQSLLTIPQAGAVFYNDCHYIFHALMCFKLQMKPDQLSVQFYDFGNTFKSLRQSAVKILDHHVNSAKRQISTTLSSDDLFTNIEAKRAASERALNACTLQIEQLASVWKAVMSGVVFEISIGTLVAHLLTLLANIVLAKEDITASDAELLGQMLPNVLAKLRSIMKINDEEGIYVVCRMQYYRIGEIVFCLNANLAQISDRWCNGIGPLAVWMKPFEVRSLVCALFQNTNRRAALLDEIKLR